MVFSRKQFASIIKLVFAFKHMAKHLTSVVIQIDSDSTFSLKTFMVFLP